MNLRQTQKWFFDVVSHPWAADCDGDTSDVRQEPSGENDTLFRPVKATRALSARQCMNIYASMYNDRLTDVLEREYPSVRYCLGPALFSEVAQRFIATHPSNYYSLNVFGARFPEFVESHPATKELEGRKFVAALAVGERAIEDVFGEIEVPGLSEDQLERMPIDAWPEAQIQFVPAFRLLALDYPINAYITSARDGQNPMMPDPNRAYIAIGRRDYRVVRLSLTELQFVLLHALRDGQSLAQGIQACSEAGGETTDLNEKNLFEWFRSWVVNGFFHKVSTKTMLSIRHYQQ